MTAPARNSGVVEIAPDLDTVLAEDPPHERTIHRYPAWLPYRRSGADVPQIGDVAHCGHVKKTSYQKVSGERLNCARCITIVRLGGEPL